MGLALVWDKSTTSSQFQEGVGAKTVGTEYASSRESQQRQFAQDRQTSIDDTESNDYVGRPVAAERIYPHIFGEDSVGSEALVFIRAAIKDVQSAIDEYDGPDLVAILGRLSQVAVAMKKAQSLTSFNQCFGGVAGYVRRAALSKNVSDVSLPGLNTLLVVLRTLTVNPMVNLDEASDLIQRLSDEGWKGEHEVVTELLAALIDDSEVDFEQVQSLLFPSPSE